MDVIGHAIRAEAEAAGARKDHRSLGLEAIIFRIVLDELEHRQIIFLEPRGHVDDEVVEAVVEASERKAHIGRGPADIGLAAPALFGGEIGVADLESLGRDVRTVGEQFLGRRARWARLRLTPIRSWSLAI